MLAVLTVVTVLLAALALIGYGLVAARSGVSDDLDERLAAFGGRAEARRERGAGEERGRRAPGRLAQAVEQAVAEKTFSGATRALLARADLRLTLGEWLIVRLVAVLVGFALGLVLGRLNGALALFLGLLGAVGGYVAPGLYLRWRIRRRVKQFVAQLGDTIALMANSLRAGYSLLQTMEMVSRETSPPIADEFRRVVSEVGLGINTQEAMAHLLRRIPSDDLDLLISAININYEVGGNLARILDVIGHTIRERVRIKGEIGVLTAQQTISGYIISLLPIVLGLVLFLVSPDYVSKMFVWPWLCMPIGSGLMIAAGFFVMRKITDIEV